MNKTILDVREKAEFDNEHIAGSVHLPLSDLNTKAKDVFAGIDNKEILIMCRSGMRAQMAQAKLSQIDDLKHKFEVYQGGILRWKSEGNPTIKRPLTERFNINRQVHLVAFIILLSGLLLGEQIPFFKVLPFLVSFGLALDAFTGFCPMRKILSFAPWNNAN